MLKAKAGDLTIFGLSARNLELLQQGKPIMIDMAELGLAGRTMIFYGQTEEAMKTDIERAISSVN
jgi:hypothetical protein